jgi:hypothetical protein
MHNAIGLLILYPVIVAGGGVVLNALLALSMRLGPGPELIR